MFPLHALAQLGPGSRGPSLDSYLLRKIAQARRELFAAPEPAKAHALARLVWRRSKLQMLGMVKEKGL